MTDRERLETALIIFESDYCFDEKSMKLADIVRQNPDILYKFQAEAWEMKQQGFKTLSAKYIVERLRYHTDATAPDRGYKISNSFTTPLSRLLEIYDPGFISCFKHTKPKGQLKLKTAIYSDDTPFGNDC